MRSMRERARSLRREMWFLLQLRRLPWRVAWFQWRAWRLAARFGDEFSRASATRPAKLAALLHVARGRRRVAELGTATGWTSISLALADRRRLVVTYDPFDRPEREQYLQLVGPAVRERLTFIGAAGSEGPQPDWRVDLLYIDSSHTREETVREVGAWRGALAGGAIVAFDDFDHPEYPGVREAVWELGLGGRALAGIFVHRLPP
jgi:predicted O-methyltransferase YrrM